MNEFKKKTVDYSKINDAKATLIKIAKAHIKEIDNMDFNVKLYYLDDKKSYEKLIEILKYTLL